MKQTYYYLFLWLCIPWMLAAQDGLESGLHSPRAGDELLKRKLAFSGPGSGGEGQTWDFSRAEGEGEDYPATYFDLYGTLTGAAGGRLESYRLSGDSLLLAGEETSSRRIRYHSPQLLLKFPLTYGSSWNSAVVGKGRYYDKMEILTEGSIESRVDGTGWLILPGGDTLKAVYRVHISREIMEYLLPLPSGFDIAEAGSMRAGETLDSSHTVSDTYLWFAEGYRYPLWETTEKRVGKTGLPQQTEAYSLWYPLSEQQYLPPDEENLALQGQKKVPGMETGIASAASTPVYRVYPNPVRDVLQVTLSLEGETPIRLSLYDLAGKCLHRASYPEQAGSRTLTLDMNGFSKGSYILRIEAGEHQVNEKIVKQ